MNCRITGKYQDEYAITYQKKIEVLWGLQLYGVEYLKKRKENGIPLSESETAIVKGWLCQNSHRSPNPTKKTLVVHPYDPSTEFLSIIYENHFFDWDILNEWAGSKEDLMTYMGSYERIIMLGKGYGNGLFNTGTFVNMGRLIIDDDFADILQNKETVSVWGDSDVFFRRHHISGYHTASLITDVSDASCCLKYPPLSPRETLRNMISFAALIRDSIDTCTPEEMRHYILDHYLFDDAVTRFNRRNLVVL